MHRNNNTMEPMSKILFFNRDLSWLSFNKRVLEIAMQKNIPVYTRIKFLAIYANNLDEFFKVRLAKYFNVSNNIFVLDDDRNDILKQINAQISKEQIIFKNIFENEIIKDLNDNNIKLYYKSDTDEKHNEFIKDFFFDKLLPFVQPTILQNNKIETFIETNSLYFAINFYKVKKDIKHEKYAIINIPVKQFGRFIKLPNINKQKQYIFIDDIIKKHIKVLFPGYTLHSIFSFRLTRDADLLIDNEFEGDLIKKIENNLINREKGSPSLFLYDKNMPDDFLMYLKNNLNLKNLELTKGDQYHNYSDLFDFPVHKSTKLEHKAIQHLQISAFNKGNSIFKSISKKDRLLHFPYHSYQYVIRFLNQAAIDPSVLRIKTTQYRVAENSAIVKALINAALNGKEVIVFVEVKARFDELANLRSAKIMKQAGVKIIYSIPGLKVHAKVALVITKGNKDNYAFLSTGNFNENTAKTYSDSAIFTTKKEIINELLLLFEHLQDQNKRPKFETLLIGKFNLKSTLIKLIEQEIENKRQNKEAHIIIKLNSLQNKTMIRKLYQASDLGIKIELIVRGICCLNPCIREARNIKLIRIVDQFLEHSRIYYFFNNGDEKLYLSSADWMNRNLNRRIECAFPIEDETMKKEIKQILKLQLNDNTNATTTDEKLNNIRVNNNNKDLNSQKEIYKLLLKKQ